MSDIRARGVDDSMDREVVSIREYESSASVALPDSAVSWIRSQVNHDADRLGIEVRERDEVRLSARSYVGIVSLPDSKTVEIRPKVPGTHLLWCLGFAYDVSAAVFSEQTPVTAGSQLVDAVGTLVLSELQDVFRIGLASGYQSVSRTEQTVRGRVDVQRQLQRQGPTPTEFECVYDELTTDIPLNRAVLAAVERLASVVADPSLATRLGMAAGRLRNSVSAVRIDASTVRELSVSRLDHQYEQLLPLVELVLSNTFVGDIQSGSSQAFSVLVNMNTVFERVVEQAVEEAVAGIDEVSVVGQTQTGTLLEGGAYPVGLTPDVALVDSSGEVSLVVDAKWKTGPPANPDFYQLAAYQQAHSCPGVLVYPEGGVVESSTAQTPGGERSRVMTLPVGEGSVNYEAFVDTLRESMALAVGDMTP